MMYIISFVGLIWAYMLMVSSRKNPSGDGLTWSEIVQIVIMNIPAPLISGLILYYGWRKTLPRKAKQASLITSVICIAWAAAIIVPVVMSSLQIASSH